MKAVVDTHALIWFLENNPRLGKIAHRVLADSSSILILPVIVLCELYYYLKKTKRLDQYTTIYSALCRDGRFQIVTLEADLIPHIPHALEMHDGIIAAIALIHSDAIILSKDEELKNWGGKRVTWT